MQEEYAILVLSVALVAIIVTYAICASHVKKNSSAYSSICTLNEQVKFLQIKNDYTYTKECKSKAVFDRTNLEEVFYSALYSDIVQFQTLSDNLTTNRQTLARYLEKYDEAVKEGTYSNRAILSLIEQRQCKKVKAKPTIDVVFHIFCKYTSPKGRNSYSKNKDYSYSDLVESLNNIRKMDQRRATKEYQRSIMTDSLRYDIMKRDGFKCVLCGATARDGAKLHVDHIIPVSKGGKTVKSNLRTLCDNCNLGKRDKYDPYGMN